LEEKYKWGPVLFFWSKKSETDNKMTCHVCYGQGKEAKSYGAGEGPGKAKARSAAVAALLRAFLEGYPAAGDGLTMPGEDDPIVAIHKEVVKELVKERQAQAAALPACQDPAEVLERSKLQYETKSDKQVWGNIVNRFATSLNKTKVTRNVFIKAGQFKATCELELTPENQTRFRLPEVITVTAEDPNKGVAKNTSMYTVCKLLWPDCATYEEVSAELDKLVQEVKGLSAPKRKASETSETPSKKSKIEAKEGEAGADKAVSSEKAPAAMEVEEEKPDYGAMTVAQLKDALREKDLPQNGVKAKLVKRLEDHFEEQQAKRRVAAAEEEEAEEAGGGGPPAYRFAAALCAAFDGEPSNGIITRLLATEEDIDTVLASQDNSVALTKEDFLQDILGKDPLAHVAVAEKEGKLSAFALFSFDFSFEFGRIIRLKQLRVVDPNDGDKNSIFTELLHKLSTLTISAGCTSLLWEGQKDDKAAQKAFETDGNSIDGQITSRIMYKKAALSDFIEKYELDFSSV